MRPLHGLDDPATLATTRREFVGAAIELLAGRDDMNVKVGEVVKAAGGHNAEFYKIFGSLRGLVLAVVEETTNRIAAQIARRLLRTHSAAEAVRAWSDGLLRLASAEATRPTALPIAFDRFRLLHQFPDAEATVVQPLKQVLVDALVEPDLDRVDAAFEMIMGVQARWLAQSARPTLAQRDLVAGYAVEIVLATVSN